MSKTNSQNDNKITPIRILTDEVEKIPTETFLEISRTIAGVVEGSTPQYTIGIYGDWGTGKSTLMRLVQSKFSTDESKSDESDQQEDKQLGKKSKKESIWNKVFGKKIEEHAIEKAESKKDLSSKFPTVWFNAWRYERDDTQATIPLMLNIINKLSDEIEIQKKSEEFFTNIGKRLFEFVKGCDYHLNIQLPFAEFGVDRSAEQNFPKVDDTLPKPTTQTGLDLITELVKELTNINKNFRTVVFIDDLDRCQQKKSIRSF